MDNNFEKTQNLNSPDANHTDASVLGAESEDAKLQDVSPAADLAAMDLKLDDAAREKQAIAENTPAENISAESSNLDGAIDNPVESPIDNPVEVPVDNFVDNPVEAPVGNLIDNSTDDNSTYDNSAELKKHKNSWRTIGIIAIITSVILAILLAVMYFYSDQKIAEGTKQIKQYQRDLTNSKTVIAEYEAATQTKVVDPKDQSEAKTDDKADDKKADKQIVKWNDLNINFAQLTTLIGDDYRITGGRIVTNEDGTKVVAKISVSKMEKVVDPNGLAMPRYVDHGMAGQTNVYTRKLPSGSWQYVGVYGANGMGVIQCKEVSEEMRAAVTVLNKYEPDANMKYSCVTFKNDNPAEGTEKTVF
ncbi:hypothetical protein HG461_002355 [Candidatus Saccharibacteria bacterium]|nr:hypothetical protein [Candidatus Saccharibacteria bacterium]